MKSVLVAFTVMIVLSFGTASVTPASNLGSRGSWDDMQKFEYYIGDLAGALNICRRFGLHSEMRALAALTPYGKQGLREWGAYDGISGAACGGAAKDAKSILGDKEQLQDYLKAKYDCSSGDCVER